MIEIKIGDKVKYVHDGKKQTGIVHAIKKHETPGGVVTRVAYLIDTGKDNPDFKDAIDRQPEQIEVEQAAVTLA